MDKDFLLSSDMAKELYHDFAEHMPILDYHCHINPQEIYEDRRFDNITHIGYGTGFWRAWWERCILGRNEFEAFRKNFYK